MSERKYFHINESSARTAHNMMSMRDYTEGRFGGKTTLCGEELEKRLQIFKREVQTSGN